MIALLLLALWPLASAHPVLEHFGLIHEAHADHDADANSSHDHDDDHGVADGSCLLTLTKVKVPPAPDAVIQLLVCLAEFQTPSVLPDDCRLYGLAPPGTAPPILATTWQFSLRTALSVRAPSHSS